MKLNEYTQAIERKYLKEGCDTKVSPWSTRPRKRVNEDALGSSNETTEQFERLYKAIKNNKSESLQIQYWLKDFIDEFYRDIDIEKVNEIYSDYIQANRFIDKAESSAKFGCGKINESLFGNYDSYDGWTEEDIELHKNIDWASRNYFDYPVDGDSFESTAVLYTPQGKKTVKTTFVKYIRSNPIFPPYYAPKDMKPFGTEISYVGPMADGHVKDGYDIHDRYETQEVYDMMSR